MEIALRVEGERLPPADYPPSRAVVKFRRDRLYGANRERLDFMRTNATLWCRLGEGSGEGRDSRHKVQAIATHLRAHASFAGCEFVTRTVDGKCVLFGRYVPPANAEAA